MKYIAFQGTYNEQVWDSKTQIVIWENSPGIKMENVKPVLYRKTWRRLPNNGLAANKAHQEAVEAEIIQALFPLVGKQTAVAIKTGAIPHVKIEY